LSGSGLVSDRWGEKLYSNCIHIDTGLPSSVAGTNLIFLAASIDRFVSSVMVSLLKSLGCSGTVFTNVMFVTLPSLVKTARSTMVHVPSVASFGHLGSGFASTFRRVLLAGWAPTPIPPELCVCVKTLSVQANVTVAEIKRSLNVEVPRFFN